MEMTFADAWFLAAAAHLGVSVPNDFGGSHLAEPNAPLLGISQNLHSGSAINDAFADQSVEKVYRDNAASDCDI